MLAQRNADTKAIAVKAIEGTPVEAGELTMRPMMMGDEMTMLELRYEAGTHAPPHAHAHESVIYVVMGIEGKKLKYTYKVTPPTGRSRSLKSPSLSKSSRTCPPML